MNRGDSAYGRLVAMLDDPECVGDVLLVGLALLAKLDLPRPELDTLSGMQTLVRGDSRVVPGGWWVKDTIIRDARTYKPAVPARTSGCEAPMLRRAGYCRSDKGHNWFYVINYQTGERTPVSYCSRHRGWADEVQAGNRAEAPDWSKLWGGAALPAANHGGVLARHFPEIDWPEYWLKLDPRWVEHPEREPRPVPRFSLVLGDDDGTSATDPLRSLALVPAGRNA